MLWTIIPAKYKKSTMSMYVRGRTSITYSPSSYFDDEDEDDEEDEEEDEEDEDDDDKEIDLEEEEKRPSKKTKKN